MYVSEKGLNVLNVEQNLELGWISLRCPPCVWLRVPVSLQHNLRMFVAPVGSLTWQDFVWLCVRKLGGK